MITEHLCPDSCQLCDFQNCPIVSWIPCIDCNRIFKSQECFDRHKQNIGQGKSLCALLVKCCHCNCVVKRGKLHTYPISYHWYFGTIGVLQSVNLVI